MRILIYGLNFKPEKVGIGKYTGELADFLSTLSTYQIQVICAPEYYPLMKIKKNKYSLDKNTKYPIYRCPIYLPQKLTGVKRLFHLFSFCITSFPILISQLSFEPDLIIFISPTMLGAINVLIFKILSKKKIFTLLHIQDFELDAAFAIGILKGKFLKNLFSKFEFLILKNFDFISTISPGMMKVLSIKGIDQKKIYYFPNWVDTTKIKQQSVSKKNNNIYRKKLNISQGTVVIQYSGSMNKKQGFEFLIPIIKHFKFQKNILWVFGGDGPTKKNLIASTKGINNIIFLPLQEEKDMNDWLNTGDIHIIPQRENLDDFLFPSKLLGILSAGKPIISNVKLESDLGKIIESVGLRVNPNDKKKFIDAINQLVDDEDYRLYLGKKAREFSLSKFSKRRVLERFSEFINKQVFMRVKE